MSGNNTDDALKQPDKGIPYVIPVEGSLGLLALGASGIKAWREKRDAEKPGTKQNDKKA